MVVVAGIDTERGVVLLSDPGSPDGNLEEVPIDVFMDAWADSDNSMIVAEGPAPGAGEQSPRRPRRRLRRPRELADRHGHRGHRHPALGADPGRAPGADGVVGGCSRCDCGRGRGAVRRRRPGRAAAGGMRGRGDHDRLPGRAEGADRDEPIIPPPDQDDPSPISPMWTEPVRVRAGAQDRRGAERSVRPSPAPPLPTRPAGGPAGHAGPGGPDARRRAGRGACGAVLRPDRRRAAHRTGWPGRRLPDRSPARRVGPGRTDGTPTGRADHERADHERPDPRLVQGLIGSHDLAADEAAARAHRAGAAPGRRAGHPAGRRQPGHRRATRGRRHRRRPGRPSRRARWPTWCGWAGPAA